MASDPEPTLRLTFEDMILEVAESLGVNDVDGSTGVSVIPTDAHDLEMVKRLVNHGYRRFYNAYAEWNWTNQPFSITFNPDGDGPLNVDGANWRYLMPAGFHGNILTPFTYDNNSGRLSINDTREDLIRQRYAVSEDAGYPSEWAIRPLGGDDRRRWEVIFWPQPTAADVVTARIRIYPNRLIELTDVPNAGQQFDEAILAAALAEAERRRDDNQGIEEAKYGDAIKKAMLLDRSSAPRNLGDYGGGKMSSGRAYTGVDTYTNLDGTVHNS